MVKKDTIGKIQLAIGIIILAAALIGLYFSFFGTNILYPSHTFGENLTDTQALSLDINYSMFTSLAAMVQIELLSTSIIGIFLSLLFITQGLLNMSGTNVNG